MDITKTVPILLYHRVHKDDDPTMPAVVKGQYCGHVTLSVFKNQMAELAKRGFSVATHRQIMEWLLEKKPLPKGKVIAIDFDDNRRNVFENAFPVMEQYGFKGTIFTISNLADGKLPGMEETFGALHWKELEVLKDSGWTIGAHTVTHPDLVELYEQVDGEAKVEYEISHSREHIEKELGIKVENFAYPMGRWNEKVEKIVKKYYRTARLWESKTESKSLNTVKTHPYRLMGTNISMLNTEKNFQDILDGDLT